MHGKVVKKMTKKNTPRYYEMRYPVSQLRYGRTLVVSKVKFAPDSDPANKTLRMTFTRCRPANPRFTG